MVIDAANSDFHSIFLSNDFDICINCSGAASVPDSLVHPLRDYILNTQNVFKVLDAIRMYRPQCKFVNLSSAAIYGNPQNLPVMENSNPAPISPYGNHKLQAEIICREFFDYYSIGTCSLRIFSAYGIGLKKQLLWDLSKKFINNNEIELFGTGNESRDFININDIINAIELCMHNATFKADQINIANGVEVTVKQIADMFLANFGDDKRIRFNGKTKAGDPLCWKADISRLKSIGYMAQVEIEPGIREYIKWVKGL